ncbi:DUF3710 domain-containing protein [Rhodococcus kunmingensis]|uniref:DUF3710 domain-containing protein n=1 Tax=Aldersonia kunmingensis TaxID=408066 RepID=UPI0008306CA9
MFGGRKKRSDRDEPEQDYAEDFVDDQFDEDESDTDEFEATAPEGVGPFDYEDVAERLDAVIDQRLDLGSVVLPIPDGAQLQVEMGQDGAPQAVHLTTQHGRITVAAYAAPKTPGQWREVVTEIADTMREQNVTPSIESGIWGRELVVATQAADLRFIGVDGYRWMVRAVAAAPPGTGVPTDGPLAEATRAVLRETVVRRGSDPHPVRAPLPVVLPPHLAEQLAAAYNQQVAAQQQGGQPAPGQPVPPQPQQAPPQQPQQPGPQAGPAGGQANSAQPQQGPSNPSAQPQPKRRRGVSGSAMQQIGRQPGESQR